MTAPIAITDTEGLTAAELARRGVATPALPDLDPSPAGTYTNATVIVAANGLVTAAESGTGGGGAAPLNINLGELGDGTTALTTSEREFIVYFEEEGTVEGWTCDGDVGAVTLDVETAPVVNGVDFVWTTRCTTGSDQRPAFSGTAPTSITLTGSNQFALTGRTALRLTVAAASGGATVVRLALHGTRS